MANLITNYLNSVAGQINPAYKSTPYTSSRPYKQFVSQAKVKRSKPKSTKPLTFAQFQAQYKTGAQDLTRQFALFNALSPNLYIPQAPLRSSAIPSDLLGSYGSPSSLVPGVVNRNLINSRAIPAGPPLTPAFPQTQTQTQTGNPIGDFFNAIGNIIRSLLGG